MMRNSDSCVVVTGAAKGLGLAISRGAVDLGYRIIGIGRTESEEFKALPLNQRYFIEFDLCNLEKIKDLVKRILDVSGGAPYALINNAATGIDGLLATQHNTDIRKIITLNLEAPILLTKYLTRRMIKRRRGRVINISSIIAQTGFNGLSVYGATKAGLEGFTRSLSRELGRVGITVNCISPGFMETDMTSGLQGKKLDSIKRRAPLGLPNTEHVASTVLHLLEEKSERITGTIFTVDGGSTA
jgi:3-oxoacyl-[acyl-carrier protein] reductase